MTKKNNNIITREMIKNGFNTGKISQKTFLAV